LGKGRHFYETDELKKKLKKEIRKQDAILIKGSRIMKMEEIVDFLKENFI
jgi:UDP-N-acetylmuramyl pentapeptide synthase